METLVSAGKAVRARTLRKPRTGGSVWPEQRCPAFILRAERIGFSHECWFCRYANFHLQERIALDVGICCWPEVQLD